MGLEAIRGLMMGLKENGHFLVRQLLQVRLLQFSIKRRLIFSDRRRNVVLHSQGRLRVTQECKILSSVWVQLDGPIPSFRVPLLCNQCPKFHMADLVRLWVSLTL